MITYISIQTLLCERLSSCKDGDALLARLVEEEMRRKIRIYCGRELAVESLISK